MQLLNDSDAMALALGWAAKGLFTTSPNPRVGCVIVRDGAVIGAGFTQPAGQAHAEIQALRDAEARGNDVRGATVYVTLEPCNHYGRTPPCSHALVRAGVGRVVALLSTGPSCTTCDRTLIDRRASNALAHAPAATRAAVSRAEARSSTLRTSVWPYFRTPARSA